MISETLLDILDTPVSPELLPTDSKGKISQKTEDIIADVVSGVVNDNYEVVVDRVEAVTKAVNIAQSGDIVVLLGKGQERVLQRGSVFEPFIGDDIAAKNALKERLNESK